MGDRRAANAGFVCRVPISKSQIDVQLTGKIDGAPEVLADIPVPPVHEYAAPGSAVRTYSDWLSSREPGLFWPVEQIPSRLGELRERPTISILLPTFNTPPYYLHRCVQSVLNQHYPFWQLCMADDGSTGAETLAHLRRLAASDNRIALDLRPASGGTSAASNSALRMASGEYVVLLDHDDELHPSALLEMVRCLNGSQEAELIYSDEDKIDDEGRRFAPAFKPPFDPNLILAFNYMGHLVCMRRTVLEQVQGFRPECDGSQDWDVLLRVIEQIGPKRIQHVPKPLYHWRSHANSTAMSLGAKPHVFRAWQRVLEDHVARAGMSAHARQGLFPGSMQVRSNRRKDSVCAVVYRSSDGVYQRSAIQRTGNSGLRLYELVFSRLHPAETLSLGPPLLTVGGLEGDVVVFLNAPFESLNHRFFDELVAYAEREDCGIVGGLVLGLDGRIRSAGLEFDGHGALTNPFAGLPHSALGYMGLAKVARMTGGIGAEFFAIRKSRLQSEGGLAMLAENTLTKTCARLVASAHAQGLQVMYTPYAVMSAGRAPAEQLPRTSLPSAGPRLNPNMAMFECSADFLRQEHIG
ncbi:MAG TPA: glycosyltransferase [Bryobacteraceae bacterium]